MYKKNGVPFNFIFLLSLNLTSSSVISFCVDHIQVMVPVGKVQVCQKRSICNIQFTSVHLPINLCIFFFLYM